MVTNLKRSLLPLLLSVLFAVSGCSGPLGQYDRDRSSESSWVIVKKGLIGGQVSKYDVELATKGSKFRAKVTNKFVEPMNGDNVETKWVVRCDGTYFWVTDRETSINGGPFEKSDYVSRWKVDNEFLRPEIFWKSNYLAGDAKEDGEVEIDGKKYKQFVSEMGNAMGGTTRYSYAVDPEKGCYRRLSRQFVGDNHIDTYDCTSYKDSTSVSEKEFASPVQGEDVMKCEFFYDSI